MGWITGGATTLVEQTHDIAVLQEVIEYGNAIVYSKGYEAVAALDGSLVVVAVAMPLVNVLPITPAVTFLVEQSSPSSTLQEVP
jgi:hypothetical protein